MTRTIDKADLQSLVDSGATLTDIGERLGVHEATIRRHMRKFGIVRTPARAVVRPPEGIDEATRLKQEVADARRVIRQYEKQETLDQRWLEAIRASGASPITYRKPSLSTRQPKDKHKYLLYLKNSDAHFGELVSPTEVNNLNRYNLEIAKERHDELWAGVLRHKRHLDGRVDELVIEFGGDNNSGSNHKELEVTNLLPAMEQCYEWAVMVAPGIIGLLDHFPKIRLVGVVGNHPRFDKKPAMKQAYNNFDWAGYKYLELLLANHVATGQIEIDFPKSNMLFTPVPGGNVLVLHGDGIRSSMVGVPWGGIIRRRNQLRDTFDSGFRYMSISHFHECHTIANNLFVNGSIKGTDEYVLKSMGVKSDPRQLLLVFSEEREALVSSNYIEFTV